MEGKGVRTPAAATAFHCEVTWSLQSEPTEGELGAVMQGFVHRRARRSCECVEDEKIPRMVLLPPQENDGKGRLCCGISALAG